MKHDDNLKVIALHPGDKEYEKVKSEFTKSVQATKSIINVNILYLYIYIIIY